MAAPLVVLGQGELPDRNIVAMLVLWKGKLDWLGDKVLPPGGCLASCAWLFWVRFTAHTLLSHLATFTAHKGVTS